jgi:hypothetical protein
LLLLLLLRRKVKGTCLSHRSKLLRPRRLSLILRQRTVLFIGTQPKVGDFFDPRRSPHRPAMVHVTS